jgi:serine phosphatase RsbU (regulator of sigma subunit)
MENLLPQEVNDRRRSSLFKFTFLAVLAYHIPIFTALLGASFNLGIYSIASVIKLYGAILATNGLTLLTIRFKAQVTKPFIQAMLYVQVIVSLFHISWAFYLLAAHRFLILICCLLALIFLFTQARQVISYIVIAVLATDYLAVSFIGDHFFGQHGNFGRDVLSIIVFLPTSSFLAYMCGILQKQHLEIKRSTRKLKTTFSELEMAHDTLETYNQRMVESLHYAEMIQRSLLPGVDRMKTESPESLIIWLPKDIVGGDIFYTCTYPGQTLITLMDCTGHGVPGAFLTLIAYTEVRKIILDGKCTDPSEILTRLNKAMKNVLHKHSDKKTNDGLDAAVIDVDHENCRIRYAGAQISLFYVQDNEANQIKGDRHSIGYASSDDDFPFTLHTLQLKRGDCVYVKTDGYTDQLGGEKDLRFGTRQFRQMIEELHRSPFSVQRKEIIRRLNRYQGDRDRLDDITVIGFRL